MTPNLPAWISVWATRCLIATAVTLLALGVVVWAALLLGASATLLTVALSWLLTRWL